MGRHWHECMSPRSRISPERTRDPGRGALPMYVAPPSLLTSRKRVCMVWVRLGIILLLSLLQLSLSDSWLPWPPAVGLFLYRRGCILLPGPDVPFLSYPKCLREPRSGKSIHVHRISPGAPLPPVCNVQCASAARNVAKAPSKLPGEARPPRTWPWRTRLVSPSPVDHPAAFPQNALGRYGTARDHPASSLTPLACAYQQTTRRVALS